MSRTAHTNVQPIKPQEVVHKGHTIKLIHRPKTNDWRYEFTITREHTITNIARTYDNALTCAKSDIDNLTKHTTRRYTK